MKILENIINNFLEKSKKPKLIAVIGPTATGKSDLAVFLAKKFNGEIISADSRQVYKGLDIGSGKISIEEMSGVPHHLLDVISPKKIFTVANFCKLSERIIVDIFSRAKTPIICGGTGFYVDTLLNRTIIPDVKPNQKLRNELNKKTTDELFEMLKKKDSERSKTIDAKNKVRLIRALEIVDSIDQVPKLESKILPFKTIWIGLWAPKEIIEERIEKRLTKRFEDGMEQEIINLHKNGLSWKRMEELGLEYRYIALYLQNKMSKDEAVKKLLTEITAFSKRQMTWFKRNKEIKWFDCFDDNLYKEAEKYVSNIINT